MSVVNTYNCRELHELADKFDCPPLKLASWHMLQEMRVGYGATPSARLLSHSDGDIHGQVEPPPLPFGLKGSGLTGPGETDGVYGNENENASDVDEYLSVFNDYTDEFRAMRGEESTSYSEEQEQLFPMPDQLPPGAPASDVIKAWAYKLQLVYDMCAPKEDLYQFRNGEDYTDGYYMNGGEGSQFPQRVDNNVWSAENDPEYETKKKNLESYYSERGLTEKIASVDNILANFMGREDKIFEALRGKYDDPDSQDYIQLKKTSGITHPKQSSKGFLGGLFS